MLGTNDFKIEFNRSAQEIAQAIQGLVELIQTKTAKYNSTAAKVLLVSPILVDGNAPRIKEWYRAYYDESSVEKSKQLAVHVEKIAQATNSFFVDAAQVARAGQDGIHFDEASHKALGELLAKKVREIVI